MWKFSSSSVLGGSSVQKSWQKQLKAQITAAFKLGGAGLFGSSPFYGLSDPTMPTAAAEFCFIGEGTFDGYAHEIPAAQPDPPDPVLCEDEVFAIRYDGRDGFF